VKVIGYARVSMSEQGDSGLGLIAQRKALKAEAKRRGWQLVAIHEDVESGRSVANRPGLEAALVAVERGEAEALAVSKLDRLSRSLVDFAGLVERARRKGWSLVALDLGVNTTEPSGELMAHVVSSFGQYERRLISERTKAALAVVRERGSRSGRPIGRPASLPPKLRSRLRQMRARGMSFARIAEKLNAEGVPTARGGVRWHPATVRAALAVKA
jgi:DNA invertase Pin-like site-specific DNA recombinase